MPTERGICPYIDECPDYIVRDGSVHIYVGGTCLCVMPIRVFQQGLARSTRALAEYYAQSADVIVIPTGRRRGT